MVIVLEDDVRWIVVGVERSFRSLRHRARRISRKTEYRIGGTSDGGRVGEGVGDGAIKSSLIEIRQPLKVRFVSFDSIIVERLLT